MPKKMIFKMSNELQKKLLMEYVDMVSEFTGIQKDKLLSIVKENSVDYVFKYAERLNFSPEQKQKLKKLKSLSEFSRLFINRENTMNLKNFDINKIKVKETDFSLER